MRSQLTGPGILLHVILTQAVAAFAMWMIYGFVLFKNSRAILRKALARPRNQRAGLGPVLLIGGAGLAFAVVYGVMQGGGFTPRGMTSWAWIAVGLTGFIFVHSQVIAASMLVTLAYPPVTKSSDPASLQRDNHDA